MAAGKGMIGCHDKGIGDIENQRQGTAIDRARQGIDCHTHIATQIDSKTKKYTKKYIDSYGHLLKHIAIRTSSITQQKMDLNSLPENDRKHVMQLLEKKQSDQFMSLYTDIVNGCFNDCIHDFTSNQLAMKEESCVKRCTERLLKFSNRIGTKMAEKQMLPGSSP